MQWSALKYFMLHIFALVENSTKTSTFTVLSGKQDSNNLVGAKQFHLYT